jgi:outer membrane receptor for ferrienterochelin and colicins
LSCPHPLHLHFSPLEDNARPMTEPTLRRLALAMSTAALLAAQVRAQTVTPAPAPEPTPTPASAPAPAPAPRVEITGGRASDSEQRRQSTAAKIVIGRDEIERFGDSNTLEVLKRLPGITIPGAPGRGGNPRMRGMAGGYTQILVDGERIAPGFALDSIPPEQIERIEILRAPTAETGARAIAGTINIVLREGFRKRLNDLNLTLAAEGGRLSPSLAWTRNDTFGDWIVNGSMSMFDRSQDNRSTSHRTEQDVGSGTTTLEENGRFDSRDDRRGVHASARIQWRGEQGSSLMLMPLFIASEGRNRGQGFIESDPDPDYTRSDTLTESRFRLARLNANFNHRLGSGGPRLEWRAGFGDSHLSSTQNRREFDAGGAEVHTGFEDTDNRDRNATLGLKASAMLGDGHQAVAGLELERNRRTESKSVLRDGLAQLTEFGENLEASSRRYAFYAQDEWSINPQWAVHVGVRSESITTRGEGANDELQTNRSRVTTPLLHAVWKPSAAARDQVRMGLTRSYRSPNLNQLIGRPFVNRVDPTSAADPRPNTELTADSAGNPRLKPEVALGLDLAVERYLAEGGVLSANLFVRRIRDLIRNVVALEEVSWSPGQPRFVSRPQNIGDALSRGIELEAKFRLDQLVVGGPPTELRANASVFSSRVDAVPGPDNRLAEQPGGTLNLGADHRFRGTPLTLGGNVNHTPGYRTRLDVDRAVVQTEKTVLDAYALWTYRPELKLRLTLSNLLAADIESTTRVQSASEVDMSHNRTRSWLNTQLRLEMKL